MLACHRKPPLTFTGAQLRAFCRSVSQPGTATAPPTTAGLSRGWYGLYNASSGANYLASGTPTTPDVTDHVTDHTGSPRFHPEGEVSTRASKLGQRLKNSFYLKAIRLLNSHHQHREAAAFLRLNIIGHFNKWNTSHFNNASLRMFTYLALLLFKSLGSLRNVLV